MSRPRVQYDGKALIPAPLVTITKNYQKAGNSQVLGVSYSINIDGTLVAYKGSPASTFAPNIAGFNGPWWTLSDYPPDEVIPTESRLGAIQRKQQALRELFSKEGLHFEVQSADGSQPIKCNPRILNISFEQGQWTDICKYTIQLECDALYPITLNPDGTFAYDTFYVGSGLINYISEASETWSLDSDETPQGMFLPRSYKVSHSVSAKGKRFYKNDGTGTLEKQPWEYAKDFVVSKLGINSSFLLSSGISNLPRYYGGYNHLRNENKDELGGSYSVQETWLLASGNALEDFSVDTSQDSTSALTRVSIQGTITGLELRDFNLQISGYNGLPAASGYKYDNAKLKFNEVSGLALSRAQYYSGKSLNILPLSTRIGRNPLAGTITYSFEYNDRPSNFISGAISEVITLNDSLQTNVIAVIPVLGRKAGPVLQNLGTSEPLSRDLSIEAVFPTPTYNSGIKPDPKTIFLTNKPTNMVSGLIWELNPKNNGYSSVYIKSNTESWNPKDGRYNRQISWIYE